jgi:hypothetical protein
MKDEKIMKNNKNLICSKNDLSSYIIMCLILNIESGANLSFDLPLLPQCPPLFLKRKLLYNIFFQIKIYVNFKFPLGLFHLYP